MGSAWIAPQVRPVGLRRVGAVAAKPGERFPPRGDDRSHPFGERITGIGSQEILIAPQGVAIECRGVSILDAEIADRFVASCGSLIRRRLRGRIRRTIEKHELSVDLFGVPRHLRALAGFIDAQSQAVENLR